MRETCKTVIDNKRSRLAFKQQKSIFAQRTKRVENDGQQPPIDDMEAGADPYSEYGAVNMQDLEQEEGYNRQVANILTQKYDKIDPKVEN